MNKEIKHSITLALEKRIEDTSDSQSGIARKMHVSNSTVGIILKRNWEDQENIISDEMWQNIAFYLGVGNEKAWVICEETRNFKKISRICIDAQSNCHARAISGGPGLSKSLALQKYSHTNKNVFYVQCGEYWSKGVFLEKVKSSIGLTPFGNTLPEMVDDIVNALKKSYKPLLIIDEADKLSDRILQFFIAFYNETKSGCGFVVAGSKFFKSNILNGVQRNKRGYAELYSRFGGEFIMINDYDDSDLRLIIKANGIIVEEQIKEIINSCRNNSAESDLRKLERLVKDMKTRIEKLKTNAA